MATFERDGAVPHYSEHGSGFPLPAAGVRSAPSVERRRDDPSTVAEVPG